MIWQAVKNHFHSLLDDSFYPKINIAVHLIVPLLVAGFSSLPRVPAAYQVEILTAVSIITGLLFSLIVFLIQLRYQVRVGIEYTHHDPLQKDNLDYAFSTSIYAIALGLITVIFLLLQQTSALIFPGLTLGKQVSNALIFGGFTHFVATIFLVLKRLWRVYSFYGKNN